MFPWPKISQTVKDYLISLIENCVQLFVPSNTASGTTSVTLNTNSGIATFTTGLSGNAQGAYTITNSLITTDSFVEPFLVYDAVTNTGRPQITSYKLASGSVVLYISNDSASATNANLVVRFRIG